LPRLRGLSKRGERRGPSPRQADANIRATAMSRRAASLATRAAPHAGATIERDLDRTSIDTIRTLAMDAVEQAKSGHPGTPMALAPAAYTLWQRVLRYDPEDPTWPNR